MTSLLLLEHLFQAGLAMSFEQKLGDPSFAAYLADVGSLAGVRSLVHHETGSLSESLVAEVAGIGTFAGVCDPVDAQKSLAGEAFAADLALVGLLAGVETGMDLETLDCLEFLATVRAEKCAIGTDAATGTRTTSTWLGLVSWW